MIIRHSKVGNFGFIESKERVQMSVKYWGLIRATVGKSGTSSKLFNFYFLDKIVVMVANGNEKGINYVPSIDQYQSWADWGNT